MRGLAAAGVLVALALAPGARASVWVPAPGDWDTFAADAQRTGSGATVAAPARAALPALHEVWSADLGGVSSTQPLFARGVTVAGTARDLVLAGSEHGWLTAADAATGATVWRAFLGTERTGCVVTPGGVFGITGAGVIDRARGAVYAMGGDDRVYGLDLATGRVLPGWPVAVTREASREHAWGALLLAGEHLYAATSGYCDLVNYRGRVVAISLVRPRVTSEYRPSPRFGGGVWGWGGVAESLGHLYIATANAGSGTREDAGNAEHVVALDSRLRPLASSEPPSPRRQDNDFGATPMIVRATGCPELAVVVRKPGQLLVYATGAIGRGPLQRVQIANTKSLTSLGTYAWSAAARMVYVANQADAPAVYRHGLLAFTLTRACRLALAWQQPFGPRDEYNSAPVVAGGAVWVSDGDAGQVAAFDAATGAPLWLSAPIGKPVYAAPTVAGGRVYVAGYDGRLHAYGA